MMRGSVEMGRGREKRLRSRKKAEEVEGGEEAEAEAEAEVEAGPNQHKRVLPELQPVSHEVCYYSAKGLFTLSRSKKKQQKNKEQKKKKYENNEIKERRNIKEKFRFRSVILDFQTVTFSPLRKKTLRSYSQCMTVKKRSKAGVKF